MKKPVMKTKEVIKNMDKLREQDVYSLSMFVLYKLGDLPKYTVISELPYIISKEDLFRLCKYYGGRTVRIPTLDEIKDTMKLVLFYQEYKIEKKDWDTALEHAGYTKADSKRINKMLYQLEQVLADYDFYGGVYE